MHIPWLGCGPPEGQAICNLHFANLCCMPQRGCPWPAASMNHIRVQQRVLISCHLPLRLLFFNLDVQMDYSACHGTTRRQTVTSAVMWRRQQLIDPLLPQLTAHVVRKCIIGDQLPLINGTLNVQRSMRCAVSSHLGDSADSNDLSIATAKATDRRH